MRRTSDPLPQVGHTTTRVAVLSGDSATSPSLSSSVTNDDSRPRTVIRVARFFALVRADIEQPSLLAVREAIRLGHHQAEHRVVDDLAGEPVHARHHPRDQDVVGL